MTSKTYPTNLGTFRITKADDSTVIRFYESGRTRATKLTLTGKIQFAAFGNGEVITATHGLFTSYNMRGGKVTKKRRYMSQINWIKVQAAGDLVVADSHATQERKAGIVSKIKPFGG